MVMTLHQPSQVFQADLRNHTASITIPGQNSTYLKLSISTEEKTQTFTQPGANEIRIYTSVAGSQNGTESMKPWDNHGYKVIRIDP